MYPEQKVAEFFFNMHKVLTEIIIKKTYMFWSKIFCLIPPSPCLLNFIMCPGLLVIKNGIHDRGSDLRDSYDP